MVEEKALVVAEAAAEADGPMEEAIFAALKRIHCQPQIYFGGTSFVGGHVTKILAGWNTFLDDIVAAAALEAPQAATLRRKFGRLGELMDRLNRDIRRCGTFSDDDIDSIESDITEFCDLYRTEFPEKSRATPKRHLLEAHVVGFLRKYKTVGLFSEDATESIHALLNRINLRYRQMRDPKARCKAVAAALDSKQSRKTRRASEGVHSKAKRVFKEDEDVREGRKDEKKAKLSEKKDEENEAWRETKQSEAELRRAAITAPGAGAGAGGESAGAGAADSM